MNARPNTLARILVKYFQDYLPALRGMSQHTIRSYRDAILLYLRFAAHRTHRRPEALDLGDFTFEHVSDFLTDLEKTRRSSLRRRMCL